MFYRFRTICSQKRIMFTELKITRKRLYIGLLIKMKQKTIC